MVKREPPRACHVRGGRKYIDGILLKVDRRKKCRSKPAIKYLVRELSRAIRRKTFLGLTMIDSQIDVRDVGHRIIVNCTSSTPARVAGQSPMKTFEVLVSDKRVEDVLAPVTGGPITDDDLPPEAAFHEP